MTTRRPQRLMPTKTRTTTTQPSTNKTTRYHPFCHRRLPAILLMLVAMISVEMVVLVSIFGPDQMLSLSSVTSLFVNNEPYLDAKRERIRRRVELYKQQHQDEYLAYDVPAQVQRYSRATPYKPFPMLFNTNDSVSVTSASGAAKIHPKTNIISTASLLVNVEDEDELRQVRSKYSRNVTIHILNERGVQVPMKNNPDDDLDHIPPYWKIVDNYYNWKYERDSSGSSAGKSLSADEQPIILGMDRCEAYRRAVPAHVRAVGPAGLFSSGTNLLADLFKKNCDPPKALRFIVRFASWQVPWGKHNPEGARLYHAAKNRENVNQTATLPVVLIRHPYSWLHAMCKHSYSVDWFRRKEMCESDVMLKNPAIVRFGSPKNRTGHDIKSEYDSVAHLYQEWYRSYFESTGYPMLMTRLEDLVYHPDKVVAAICACVGGKMKHNFTHLNDSANRGDGHGKYRSDDLLTAFVKHARPFHEYGSMFSASDKRIMSEVFQQYPDLYSAFRYYLPLLQM